MLDARALGDGDILDASRFEINPEQVNEVRYKIVLGKDDVLTSEWGDPTELRKKAMAWCETVRDQVAARQREAEAKQERGEVDTPDLKPAVAPNPKDDDPLQWAKDRRDMYSKTVAMLREQIAEREEELQEAQTNRDRWNMVVCTLEEREENG